MAIYQDVSGNARERAFALGVSIGSGYLYETTFKKEVYSDLTGERGTLMGAIQGMFKAQYEVLRERGHTPSEAFNETVEEATQSLYPLVANHGMDWMYANCSTTAQRVGRTRATRAATISVRRSIRCGLATAGPSISQPSWYHQMAAPKRVQQWSNIKACHSGNWRGSVC